MCHSDLSVVNGDRVRPLPMALGHEAVGVVEETGPGVRRFAAGDHVAPGLRAELRLLPGLRGGQAGALRARGRGERFGRAAPRPLPPDGRLGRTGPPSAGGVRVLRTRRPGPGVAGADTEGRAVRRRVDVRLRGAHGRGRGDQHGVGAPRGVGRGVRPGRCGTVGRPGRPCGRGVPGRGGGPGPGEA
nr:alcohol dehydrogenase catalytic domain-containing protein [Streptomyces sp. SID4912]